ncbi:MAG: PAS domain S-box protein [Desulfobacteraceae bacterium]|nr:PAS domain S-box protein [Desulfobacteraceae bacterium]
MSKKLSYEDLEKRILALEQAEAARLQDRQALQESEDRFHAVFEGSKDAVFIIDTSAQVIHVNQAACKLTGYSREELLKKSITDLHVFDPFFDKVLKGDSLTSKTDIRRKDGISVPVEFTGTAVSINGKICRHILVRDITEHKQKEDVLRNSEQKFRQLFDHAPSGIYEVDFTNGRFTQVNSLICEYTGYSREELLTMTPLDILDEDSRHLFFERLEKFGRGESVPANPEYCIKNKNGTRRWVQLNNQFSHTGGLVTGATVVAHDISERKQAEDALKNSEALFKSITDHTSALVSIHDAAGTYLFASPSHEQLGYQPEELMGQSGFTMVEKQDIGRLLQYLEKLRTEKIAKGLLNYRLKDKAGNLHDYRGAFDSVFKKDGSLEKIVCVGEDITELKKAQTEKIEALTLAAETQKLALVGQIAGKMAHDFNNILGVIMGNAELALFDCPHIKTQKTLELIFEQTLRGKNLTKNLVAFAKDQEPKQEFFSINEKMALIINLLKKDLEGIHLIRLYGHQIPALLADPGMIEHAVVNLIQNSIHAVSLVKQPKIILRTYHKTGRIFIEIEDNGCGIPPESLGEIFEPAFTLKGSKDRIGLYKSGIKGTGYGMSNVKKYIEQHKGAISIHSELWMGTTVAVSLPVTQKTLTEEEIKEVKKENPHRKKYILIVEDEQDISNVQYRLLSNEPFFHKVDIADNGRDAMDLVDKNKYDLISLDYVLPGKLNGMDVYHHIRGENQTLPVLFISGNIEFLESIKALKRHDPYIDHLSKPCKNIDYVNSVNLLFAEPGTVDNP